MPRDEGTYYLDTDASDRGLGAVLSQNQDGREAVLAYSSRVLSKAERNYDVTRRELLAVVFGLKAYRQYLLGRHFVIRTDHSALQSLRRTPEPIGQQARWQSFVEQFNFVIMHRPGTQHRNADALSRRPPIHSNEEVRHKKCATTATDKKMARIVVSVQGQEQALAEKCMSDLQRDDPDIGPVLRRRLEQIEPPKPEETVAESAATKEFYSQWHGLVPRNGSLFRRVEGSKGGLLSCSS